MRFFITMNLLYTPFTKVEETPDGLIVEGVASSEALDSADEVVDYESLKARLPDYQQWMNIRAMHQPIAAGKALVVTPDDVARTVFLRALIVDDDSQRKVRAGVYKGFSIGGKGEGKVVKRDDGSMYTRQYVKLLSEISIVDRPANPDARFTLVKLETTMGKEQGDTPETPQAAPALDAETIAAIKKLAGQTLIAGTLQLEKAATDPAKIVAQIQAARNELELAGDMEGAALYTQAIALVQQAAGEAEDPATEETTEESPDETAMALAAKTSTLRKAGRAISGTRLASLEQTAKALLQMMAGAGHERAAKALSAWDDGAAGEGAIAAAIGAELTKVLSPVGQALLNINGRLEHLERLPAPGGPALRRVEKTLTGQSPPTKTELETELESLQKLAETTIDPLQRTALRERMAYLQAKQLFVR